MPRLLMVRHLKPLVEPGICYGSSDVAAEQSSCANESVIAALASYDVRKDTRFYSSPLTRCTQLSEVLVQAFNIEGFEICTELAEIDFGDWEMKPWNDIERSSIDAWAKDIMGYQFPQGESALIMQSRIKQWLSELSKYNGDSVVVCHAGTMRQLLALIEQTALEKLLNKPIGFGEVISVNFGD